MECNLRGMTTWVPTHAPNLWVIRPGSALSYSRAMHADHPWNVTLTSRLFPRGSLIVAHPTASSTPPCTDPLWPWLLPYWVLECGLETTFFGSSLLFGLPRSEFRGLHAPRLDAFPSSATLTCELPETLVHPPRLPVDPVFGAPPWLWSTSKSEDWSVQEW